MLRHLILTILLLSFVVGFSQNSSAQQPEGTLIPRVKFYSQDNIWDVKVNSNAKYVAYDAPLNGKPSIWIANPSNMAKAKPLKVGEGFSFRYFEWSLHPDYLVVFADNAGDEKWQLISINVHNGKQIALSPNNGQRAELIGFDQAKPTEILIAHNLRDPSYNDLYRVDMVTGNSVKVYENTEGYTGFYTDLNGQLKLAKKINEHDQSFTLEVPKKLKNTKSLSAFNVAFEDTRSFKFLQFSPDSNAFYVLSAKARDTAALLKVDYQTGEVLTLGYSDLADIKDVAFHPTEQRPIAFASDYIKREWRAIDKPYVNLFKRLTDEFDGRVDLVSSSRQNAEFTIYISGKYSSYYALLNIDSGEVTKLAEAYPQLAKYSFTPKVGVIMKTRDNKNQTGTFVAAHGSDKDGDGFPDYPTPLIVMAHGGPWDQSRPGFDTWQQWLANRGYSVISPNFRASTGLGKQWLNEGNREWGGVIQNDIVDAIQWAIDKGYADKNRIGSIGASFGGYVSLRLITEFPNLLSCAISTAASPNLVSLYEQLPDYWQAYKKEYLLRVGDATTEEGREMLKKHSPLFYADRITKPLLIFHGENDSRVNIAEPRQIVAAMQKRNQKVHFAISSNSGHGSSDPDSELAYQAIVEKFFAGCLGGSYEPYRHKLEKSNITFEAGGDFFTKSNKHSD